MLSASRIRSTSSRARRYGATALRRVTAYSYQYVIATWSRVGQGEGRRLASEDLPLPTSVDVGRPGHRASQQHRLRGCYRSVVAYRERRCRRRRETGVARGPVPVQRGHPIGVDEKVWGRTRSVWLDPRPDAWRKKVGVVASNNGFAGLKTATTEELPNAVQVIDPLHAVRLSGDALDRCRQCAQQRMTEHRARSGDPLDAVRRRPAHRSEPASHAQAVYTLVPPES
ncbi:hypothetical protein ACVLV4_000982 [Rathayibacter agropyri]